MVSRLGDRLSTARRRRFVGRAVERTLLESALTATDLPFSILYIYGPGGIGKTTLLGEFKSVADQVQIPAVFLDARHIEPSPESFLNALRLAMGMGPAESPLQYLSLQACRTVILIDTYEALAPLDGWLREVFLPELPENVLIVLAGRYALPTVWRTDPGWQALVRVLPLRNFDREESRTYLIGRGVPAEQHRTVLNFTYGHPLALSLVADLFDQRPGVHFKPEAAPDVIKILLEELVQKVPGPAHRAALEACALVRLTTEPLLATMLAMPDAHELFDWLRSLSCIELGAAGLFPHDLAREALAADLRWRNPDWYAVLHQRARTYYAARLQQTRGEEQQAVLIDYIFLHRDNPVVRPFFAQLQAQWQESSTLMTDIARENDWPVLLSMVAQHEGEESARLASYWFERQPRGVQVFRTTRQRPVGFSAKVSLRNVNAEDLAADPAVRAAWHYLEQHAPLRPGESATLFRFWMAEESYQDVSVVQSYIFVNTVQHYLTTPGLAFTFFPCAGPDFWMPMFAYADLVRLPEADFEVGGRRYGVFGHDWRAVPPAAWLALLAEREIAIRPQSGPAPQVISPVVVLSQGEFALAVKHALRDFQTAPPETLYHNPLLHSRLVVDRVGTQADNAERVASLQTLIREAAARLQSSPRLIKLYNALYHTYFQPAPTQEQAAELLDLPFSTFRRHLKAGIAEVTNILWQQEIGEGEK